MVSLIAIKFEAQTKLWVFCFVYINVKSRGLILNVYVETKIGEFYL